MPGKLARDVLLPFYERLFLFFQKIFECGSRYKYVVFISRRCSNLAEIFYRLSSSFKSMGVGGFPDNFINDSALLSLAGHLADAFRQTGHFPQVLIVDDIVIHGQALSTFLEEIEELLFSLLPGFSRETIIAAWLRGVDIRAFARNNQPLLLTSRYQPNFTVAEIMAPKRWRDLSNRISRLIQLSGRVNSSFVSGADVEPADGQVDWDSLQVKGFTRVDTEYDFFPQTLFYRPVVISSGVYAIYSVRLFTSSETGGMVAAPFVFLPDLPVENVEEMIRLALSQLRTRLISTALEPGGCWEKCPRTRLEALTLLLSSSLLNEVCALAGLTPTYNGQIKLAMNYGAGQVDASKYFVSGVLSPAPLLSLEQMDALIASCAALPEYSLINVPASKQGPSPESDGTALMEYMENTAYAISLKNYTWLYTQTQICQTESPEDIDTPDSFVLLRKLLRQMERGATYSLPLPQLIAWMFQLLDAGILAVAVRTVLRNGVYCAAQCAKTGEQSQFILPKRYQQFIPVLIFIQKKSYILDRDFGAELERFAQANEDFRRTYDGLVSFMDGLKASGQSLADWDFNLLSYPNINGKRCMQEFEASVRVLQTQRKYVRDYSNMIHI